MLILKSLESRVPMDSCSPGCSPHLREHLEYLINSFPVDWRALPETGEQFETLTDSQRRLTVYAIVTGFNIPPPFDSHTEEIELRRLTAIITTSRTTSPLP